MADQLDRKKLIAFIQFFSFVFLVVLTVLTGMDYLRPWHIYTVTAVLGITSVLGQPARSAITANIVPTSYLMHAVTLNTATFQIGAIFAPLIFTVTITQMDTVATFGIASIFALPGCVVAFDHTYIRFGGRGSTKGVYASIDVERVHLGEIPPYLTRALCHGYWRYYR